MSVAKNKKRVMVTIDEKVIDLMKDIQSQNCPKFKTFSQIINAAVVYMYMVLNGYTTEETNNEKEEEKDEKIN